MKAREQYSQGRLNVETEWIYGGYGAGSYRDYSEDQKPEKITRHRGFWWYLASSAKMKYALTFACLGLVLRKSKPALNDSLWGALCLDQLQIAFGGGFSSHMGELVRENIP